MNDTTLKMLFLRVLLINSTLRNLIKLIDLDTKMVGVLNMKLLSIVVTIVLYQLEAVVLLNVLIL